MEQVGDKAYLKMSGGWVGCTGKEGREIGRDGLRDESEKRKKWRVV